jgi:hypothetical protein
MLLSKNEIRAIQDRKTERVAIPEWGEGAEVIVRQMSAYDRELYESYAMMLSEQRTSGMVSSQQLYARMAIASCCDEHGDTLFTMDDIEWLSQKSYVALKRIFDVAWRINLIDPEEVEKAVSFLEPTSTNNSGIVSPSPSGDVRLPS